ncbi:MAG TPA: hypothetical protein PK228_10940 [Saprospiraceae bacterium]|nr:hypothetical protein [Saprospiraceae bacterium]
MSVLELKGEVREMLEKVKDERQLKRIKSLISNFLDTDKEDFTQADEYMRKLLAALDEADDDMRILSEEEVQQIFNYLKRQYSRRIRSGEVPIDNPWFDLTPDQQDELLLSIAESYDSTKLVSSEEARKLFQKWKER